MRITSLIISLIVDIDIISFENENVLRSENGKEKNNFLFRIKIAKISMSLS